MKICGVVVLYNPDDKVIDNIKSYLKPLDRLFIVDNSPIPNDNKDQFKDKKIEYISNNGNKGIANALNVGAKEAIKLKADWLLTMDQDSSFQEGALEKMLSFLKELRSNQIMSEVLGLKYDKLGVLSALQRTELNKNDKLEGIDYPIVVMTSGNLINLNIYKEIDGFKDWFFIDGVDFEYCLNVKKNGYEVVQMNTAELKHNLGNIKKKEILGKKVFVTNHSATRRYYITRNRHYLYDLYHEDFLEYCALELDRTKHELLKIILFETHKIDKIKAIYRGYRDYKKGKTGGIE